MPWLGACTALRLTQQVQQWWWRSFWWLVAMGAGFGAAGTLFVLLIGLLIIA